MTGSEKTKKFLHFFYRDGLKIFASDGCIESIFNLKQNLEEFSQSYAVSIKTLKLFIEDNPDEMVLFNLIKNAILIRQNNEILSIKHLPTKKIPEQRVFESLGTFKSTEFLSGLDFSTVHMPENDDCYFFVSDGILFILTIYDKVFCLYNTQSECANLEAAIPYQSVRHLLKALLLLKTEEFRLGGSQALDRIGFQTVGNLTSICSRTLEHKESERIMKLISFYSRFEPVHRINREILKKNVTKAERISPNLPINMILEPKKLTFELRSESFYYSCVDCIDDSFKLPGGSQVIESPLRLTFYGRYLKSALSRITTKDIYVYQYENLLAFGDEEKKKLIVLTDIV